MRGILTPDEIDIIGQATLPAQPRKVIREVGRTLTLRARFSDTFVRHPLGFVCIPMHRGRRHGICIHLWTPSLYFGRPTTSAIHAHSWDLRSYVLCGTVMHVPVELDYLDRRPTHRICTVTSSGRVDTIEPTEHTASVRRSRNEAINSGTTYLLPAHRYHSTNVDGLAVTVVFAEHNIGPEYTLGPLTATRHSLPRSVFDLTERSIIESLLEKAAG